MKTNRQTTTTWIACYAVVLCTSFYSISAFSLPTNEKLVPVCLYKEVTIASSDKSGTSPRQAVSVEDLTPLITSIVKESGLEQGTVTVISRHTTTAITINELESRLARDIETTFLRLVPPDERSASPNSQVGVQYEHNDIGKRPESDKEADRCRENGWDIDDDGQLQAWRDQEPINAHSHLISMMLGSSESIPVVEKDLVIGKWQSVLLVDLDGPRERTVGIQVIGFR